MRVLFFGTPSFAAPTLAALVASRHTVVGVVTQPDRARGRGQKVTFAPVKQLALEHGLPVFQPVALKSAEALDTLRGFGADIGVVAAYGKILPQALLDIPPRGLINVHASLLPRWRGAAPIHRAILAGDRVTGVTIMRVVLALDAGAMLSKIEMPIDDAINSVQLEQALADRGATLLVETVNALEAGAAIEVPQDEALVTYARKIERQDGQMDWSRSAREIHNQIRGLLPWPMASARFRDKRVILRASEIETEAGTSAEPGTSAGPGTILDAHGDTLRVATGSGVLRVTEVQLEGRSLQAARDFINGLRPLAGERFSRLPDA